MRLTDKWHLIYAAVPALVSFTLNVFLRCFVPSIFLCLGERRSELQTTVIC